MFFVFQNCQLKYCLCCCLLFIASLHWNLYSGNWRNLISMPGTTFVLVLGTAIIIRDKQHRKLMLKSQIKVLLVKRCCCLCSQETMLKGELLQHILVIVTAAQLVPGGCRSPPASCSVKAWSCDAVTSEDFVQYSGIYYSDLSADCLSYCTVDFCSSS